jgi:hypothetical protein
MGSVELELLPLIAPPPPPPPQAVIAVAQMKLISLEAGVLPAMIRSNLIAALR